MAAILKKNGGKLLFKSGIKSLKFYTVLANPVRYSGVKTIRLSCIYSDLAAILKNTSYSVET